MRYARWVAISTGFLLVLASQTSNAQGLPQHVFAVSPDEEIQDLLFLGDTRPLLIRLHIRVNGEGHHGRWREFVGRLHVDADTDSNRVVTRAEANRAIDRVYQLQTNSAVLRAAPQPRRPLLVPPDIVTFEDMADQMRSISRDFEIVRQAPAATSNDEATFRLLDRDHDGYLSLEELAVVASSLAGLDIDDDETINAEELGINLNPAVNRTVVRTTTGMNATPAQVASLIMVSDQRPQNLAQIIIRRYDAGPIALINREQTLQAGELPIAREAFVRIDSNRNGSIDATELERAIKDVADLELIVRLGRREPGQATIERLEGSGRDLPFGAPGFRMIGDLILIELATTMIELRTEPDGTDPSAATRATLETRFRTADLDSNGYLDKAEMHKVVPLATRFEQADRNGDGKLTEAEWRAHADRQAEVTGLRTFLQSLEQGPSFLDLLDDNRDRRLGPRELQDAARRILLEDRDGDGQVSLREFAKHHRWTLARSQATSVAQAPILMDQRPRSLRPARRSGLVPQNGPQSRRRPLPPRVPRHPCSPSRDTTPIGTA